MSPPFRYLRMQTVSSGNDGPPITKIELGCWRCSGGVGGAGSYWPALPEDETNAIVSARLRCRDRSCELESGMWKSR